MTVHSQNGITLIDSSSDSLTVSWPSIDNASPSTRYVLQYRLATDEARFETLTDKLTSTQARKRNLKDQEAVGFLFRVTSRQENEEFLSDDDSNKSWITHSKPFYLLTQEEESKRMAAPTVSHAGSNLALRVAWKESPEAKQGYELQMRENLGGAAWETIAPSLSGTEAKKKNLKSKNGYQFRVRPNTNVNEINDTIPFSAPSEAFTALGLSEGMLRVFQSVEDRKLLRQHNQPAVGLEDALGGKEFILLYASAHWCPPCRQFTPQLANWYKSLGPNKPIEIVFLSADHDESGFNSYYSTMPWMAVPFDDDGREALMGHIRVQGIPRLAVLDGKTGRIIEDNAVGKPFDISRWRKLASSS